MKAPYALVFVLFSFAAHAQTSDNSIPPYYVDDVDCSGAMNQQGSMPPQIIGIEQFCATMLSAEDGVANANPSKDAEDIPVGVAGSNDEPAVNDAIEQSVTSTQIAATKPTIEASSEAKPDAANDAVIIGPKGAEDIPVGAVQPSEQNSTVKYSTADDDELAEDDTNEQSATSTRIVATKPAIELEQAKIIEVDDVATTGPGYSQDVQVGAPQVRKGQPTGTYSDQSDDPSRLDETIE